MAKTRKAANHGPSRILYEVEAIVCAAFGAVLALSFISYVPNTPTDNYVGKLGYWLANLLVQTFGYASYLFPLLLAGAAVALFANLRGMPSPIRGVGAVAMLLDAAVLLGLFRTDVAPELAGGWVGGFLATLMRDAFGVVGSTILLIALGLLVWLMLTGTPLSHVLGSAAGVLLRALHSVLSMLGARLRALLEGLASFKPAFARAFRAAWAKSQAVSSSAPEALADPPVVFGSEPEVAVDPKHAESIVQITKPEPHPRGRKRNSEEESEADQEEFVFTLEHDDYKLPPVRLLGKCDDTADYGDEKMLVAQSKVLEQKLATFGVSGRVVAVRPGPVITTFEFEPDAGIKVSRVVNLCDDLTMALRAHGVRIVAPIPGKNVVGIEVSNRNRAIVGIRDLIDNDEFTETSARLPLALGRDTTGVPAYADLAKMPHLLMAGATGTGKSVALNSMIVSVLCKCTPRNVRFIMIDPKMLELSLYEGIPHLLVPVVTDVKKAAAALANVMREMDRRFELMKDLSVRSIDDYNARVAEGLDEYEEDEEEEEEFEFEEEEGEEEVEYEEDEDAEEEEEEEEEEEGGLRHEHLPRIVLIVDELADLMMSVGREVEQSITRLAQKARAAGIHLIVATQRPSVDVITGLIKANFPCRVSFQVTARPDSRTILDSIGAERLLGNGDMLYMAPSTSVLRRLHGGFISDHEIISIVKFLKKQGKPEYNMELLEMPGSDASDSDEEEFLDELYDKAVDLVLEHGQGSTSWVQRKLGIGYNRAARIMENMEREGVVGPADGARPRKVLVGPNAPL